jgi:hypothetical protein
MSELTYYVALPFVAADDGIAAGEATECFNSNAAIMGAEALSLKDGHVGAIAFSRTGDPGYGQFQRCQGAVLSGQRKPAVSAGWSISHRVVQMRMPDINSAQSAPPAASRPAPKIAASVAVYALAPIVGLHTRRRPRTGRAKAVLISNKCIRGFRAKGIGIPNSFAHVRFVVSGEVFARRSGICHRRDNQSRPKQAKDRGSHYGGEN